MCHCPRWAQRNRAPAVQPCLASWDLCSRQCHSFSFLAGPLWVLSSRRVCVAVSKEGFSQCTPDSALRTLCIPLPPCQNWHQSPAVVVTHFTSILVPAKPCSGRHQPELESLCEACSRHSSTAMANGFILSLRIFFSKALCKP